MAEAALDQKLGTLLKMHEEAFRQLGGVPEEILYDRMKPCGWRSTSGTKCNLGWAGWFTAKMQGPAELS